MHTNQNVSFDKWQAVLGQVETAINFAVRAGRRWVGSQVVVAVLALSCASLSYAQQQKVILVTGAPGTPEYETQFESWADNWMAAIESAREPKPVVVRIGSGSSDHERLKAEIEATDHSTTELWIVLIGHGTDDRKAAKFNLRGPDVSASQLNEWLEPISARVVVINCSSASGRFINALKHENRIVVTATKSGAQHNFARFGGFLSQAIANPAFDLDKDQQTSLLEAFLAASSEAQEFYVQETRLATELAMIDDNGDGLGTPADWFQGVRVVRKSKEGEPDGFSSNQVFLVRGREEAKLSAEQRQIRDDLELKLERLRARKSTMTEDVYYQTLEPILIELADIYANADEPVSSEPDLTETTTSIDQD